MERKSVRSWFLFTRQVFPCWQTVACHSEKGGTVFPISPICQISPSDCTGAAQHHDVANYRKFIILFLTWLRQPSLSCHSVFLFFHFSQPCNHSYQSHIWIWLAFIILSLRDFKKPLVTCQLHEPLGKVSSATPLLNPSFFSFSPVT